MDDRDAVSPTLLQDPASFPNGTGHIVRVLKGHEADHEISDTVVVGQVSSICDHCLNRWISFGREADHGSRGVDCQYTVSTCLQIARHPPFPTTDIERQPARWGHEPKKGIAMKAPVAVMPGFPGPPNPVFSLLIPGIP